MEELKERLFHLENEAQHRLERQNAIEKRVETLEKKISLLFREMRRG